ncbi:hypothetical protein CYMTET_7147 [Cymbomonas tetramitiformis]|uniref:DUS-like FMN-binding domain-containing protein n=1 Tax=Cymbomonas tetramitiformis TaxID=36881 RepID=A0AAE0GVT2_9CHLO|nr:hypothetical protein CYMTET_7147 [Cymbomonas tetramitiformis]
MDTKERFAITTGGDYHGKNILAPMVRVGTLPMRLLAAQYGAHITYGEELIDRRVMTCRRVENNALGTTDFIDKDQKLMFRTCEEERTRIVFQMGTADAVNALKAAEIVCRDVQVIDINMGCPKHFSTSGDMGAKLLHKPDTVWDILTTLRRNLPCPVSCKIRLLDTPEKTLALAQMIERADVIAMAVHGRYIPQRPRDPAHWDRISEVVAGMSIPVIANGDVFEHGDFERLRNDTGAVAAMTARGAQWNASIFRHEGLLPLWQVKQDYVRHCIVTDNAVANSKYVIKEMIMKHDTHSLEGVEGKAINKCKDLHSLAQLYDLDDFYCDVIKHRTRKRAADESPNAAVIHQFDESQAKVAREHNDGQKDTPTSDFTERDELVSANTSVHAAG